jgi:eukaryotic-like serine/threonine-protein kinase
VIAGRYRLEERIGAGGMGEVYRATHLELNVPVAVKLIGPAIAGQERAVKRFRREARAAARLKSAHIVHVYDFGVDGTVPFLVMELLEGEPLSQRLARLGKLTLTQASALLGQAGRGLAVAHAQGVVHRDVKPSNCFLARTPDGEVLKVLDFGIAKPEDEDVAVTASHEVIGSPLYMSPEQVNGADVDQRGDAWALAALAFRMVTGGEAFGAPTTSAVLGKICSGRVPRASALAPELSASVDAFFERAFAPALEDRFASTLELTEAFARLTQSSDADSSFFRTAATASLTSLPSIAPVRRSNPRWPWIAAALAVTALALAAFFSRNELEPAREPAVAVKAVTAVSAPAAPPSVEISTVTAPAARPSATATNSAVPPAPPRPRAAVARPMPKAAPSPSTGARPTDRKSRDPLFGL